MAYYVYILTNKSGTIYTGATNDLMRRTEEHYTRQHESFTEKYKIDKLIYYEEFEDVKDAIAAEKKIKGWTRKKKMTLIRTLNPEFRNLLEGN